MTIYTTHYRTVLLMHWVHRVLLKRVRLKYRRPEAGDAEFVPDGRTNHGERTTAVRVELYSWHEGVGGGWPNEGAVVRRLGRPACTARGQVWDSGRFVKQEQ